jgi:hypothetical protein
MANVPNTYDQRDEPRITATFTNAAGAAIDPSGGVVVEVKAPDGTYIGYHYGLSDQGAWNAATNTPALSDGTGTAGQYYTVSAAGAEDFGHGSIAFAALDLVYYNGRVWQRLRSPSAVALVKSATGVYTVDRYTFVDGAWVFRAEGLGTGQCAAESSFVVRQSAF